MINFRRQDKKQFTPNGLDICDICIFSYSAQILSRDFDAPREGIAFVTSDYITVDFSML
jgi:hypothetical protein